MSWLRMLALIGIAAMLGCGDDTEEVQEVKVAPRDAVKAALENIAETGSGGSEMGAIMEELKKLEEADPSSAALVAELQEDAAAFMSTQNSSDQLKQKAKDMIKKLEGGGSGG